MAQILKCDNCGSYGLSEGCSCSGKRVNPKPPKYSHPDRYAKYRREYKKEKGLL